MPASGTSGTNFHLDIGPHEGLSTTVVLWQPYFDLRYFVCKSKLTVKIDAQNRSRLPIRHVHDTLVYIKGTSTTTVVLVLELLGVVALGSFAVGTLSGL